MDQADNQNTFLSGHEADEGILDRRTGKRYPTSLAAMVGADSFNDLESYTNLDISGAKTIDVEQLYRERLEDLRHRNNYLELWWGGGYDSTKLLYVSMETNKPFDAITLYCVGDPRTNPSQFDYELRENYHHVRRYLERFPDTKVNFIDLDTMWEITKDKYHDHIQWCATNGDFDEVSQISADDLLQYRNKEQGAIITGKGYGGVVYNRTYDTWSYYNAGLHMNFCGAYSTHLPVTRFYYTPDIIRSTAEMARSWFYKHNPDFEEVWTTTETWDHENIRYPDLMGKIKHLSKDPWPDCPKMTHWMDHRTSRAMYKEYWEFVDWLDENIAPDSFGKNKKFTVVEDLRKINPACIDF